jgi:CubicO group peptidase (beta-lactamase class C family)
MRRWKELLIAMSALGFAPLLAQGPAPRPAASSGSGERPLPAPAAAVATLDARDVTAWLDGFVPYALERGRIAGAVVVVVRDGQPLAQKGYGFADLATRKPVDPATTLFRPGSVSKLFTWTAVMQQVEAGKLDLDRDVNGYLDFKSPPRDGKPITLRHILTHTAGFEESIRYLISNDPKAVMPLRDYVRRAMPARVFAPGTTPAYSNYATALAGYIVERVSGQSFDDYVDSHIFAPLGMRHSTFRQPLPPALRPFMASGYPSVDEKAKPFEIVIPAPAGSMSSSGADMGKFMLAHLAEGGPLLRPETARAMHNYRAPAIGPLDTMALGFYEQHINGRRAIAHGGDTTLFHSYLWLFPAENIGLYISMSSSGREGSAQAVRSALVHKFADRYLPETRRFRAVDAATAKKHAAMLAGTYVQSRGAFTNFMSLLGVLQPTKVAVGPEGQLLVPLLEGLGAGARDWVEIAPFVWRDRTTGERLAAEVMDGRVVRLSTDAISPFTVLTPAPVSTNLAWLLPALLAALATVLIAALAWPVRALVRRDFKAPFPFAGATARAYRLSRAFAWLVLLAVAGWIGLVVAFSADIGAIGGPLDWLIHTLRILTPVAALGLLATTAWLLVRTFRDKRRWTMKLGALLLVLAGLVLSWVTFAFHLYGFSLVY